MNAVYIAPNVGIPSGNFSEIRISSLLPTGETYTQFTLIPTKTLSTGTVNKGLPRNNSYYVYLGTVSGQYPIVLNPTNAFNGDTNYMVVQFPSNILLNNTKTGLFCNIAGGDGLYVIAD
jgi:hypothetical protein